VKESVEEHAVFLSLFRNGAFHFLTCIPTRDS
jgi:hypothetical protein